MENIDQLLDAAKQKNNIKSDYKFAPFIGKTTKTLANYRHGRSRPDDKTLCELASLADVPQTEIELMAVQFQAERATTEESRKLWESLAKRLQKGVADVEILALVAIILLATFSVPVQAAIASVFSDAGASVYYVKYHLNQTSAQLLNPFIRRSEVDNILEMKASTLSPFL